MRRFALLCILLVLCCAVAAQDSNSFTFFGSGDCDTILNVSGEGNGQPILLTLTRGDEIVEEAAAPYIFRVPMGTQQYTLTAAFAPDDVYAYWISVSTECPPPPYVDAEDAWLQSMLDQIDVAAHPEFEVYTIDILREMLHGDPTQGYGAQSVIDLVNYLQMWDAATETPPIPTEEPTPAATEEVIATQESG